MTTVTFSCKSCGLPQTPCQVPSRRNDQTMEEWLAEVVSFALAHRHRVLSLFCESDDLDVTVPKDYGEPEYMVIEPRRRDVGGEG